MPFDVSEDRIAEAERQLECHFPAPMRERLLRSNGGTVEADDDDWELFPVWDSSDRKRMGRTANHIVRETNQAREWRGFPQGHVAIARNGYGDLLVLEKSSGSFAVWDHETEELNTVDIDWS